MEKSDRDIVENDALRDEARAWLRRLTSGTATQGDVEALEHWRNQGQAHAKAFAEAALLWDLAGEATNAAVGRVVAHLPNSSRKALLARRTLIGGGVALAASIAGLALVRPPLGLWPSLSEIEADYRTRTGERRNIEVAGSVSVDMNTQTSIDLRSSSGGVDEIELLAGEAMIAKQVNPSRLFTVRAGSGRTTASQASFNIRKDTDRVCVTCIRGDVRIAHRLGTALLREQQQVSYDVGSLGSIGNTDTGIVTAWRDGLLIFRDTPLARVIEEVNRYRHGRIILVDGELGRRLVVADFRLDRLDAVVEFVASVMNAPVRSLPGGIVLLG
jgi:transmembrane sensor